jgi:fructoselysine 6-kinase
MTRIVALSVCCVDYYPQLGKSFLGGNSLNYAVQAKIADPTAEISVIAAVGTDVAGDRIINFLKSKDISTTKLYRLAGNTASNHIINDEFGERFGITGKWENGVYGSFHLSEDDWSFALSNDIIAIPANNPNFEMLKLKRRPDSYIVSDFLDVENKIPIEENIKYTDIAQVAGRMDLLDYYSDLARRTGKLLIVTLGSKGSVVFKNGETFEQRAIDVPIIIDTTGCGDTYLAAFSIEYYNSWNIPKAMQSGAVAASYVLQHYGGVKE